MKKCIKFLCIEKLLINVVKHWEYDYTFYLKELIVIKNLNMMIVIQFSNFYKTKNAIKVCH